MSALKANKSDCCLLNASFQIKQEEQGEDLEAASECDDLKRPSFDYGESDFQPDAYLSTLVSEFVVVRALNHVISNS